MGNKFNNRKIKDKTSRIKELDKSEWFAKEVDEIVESFLLRQGGKATLKLINDISKISSKLDVRKIVKVAIAKNIKENDETADKHSIYFHESPKVILQEIDANSFMAKNWKNVAFILSDEDYLTLLTEYKIPINVNRYDYDAPIYAFKNNYVFEDAKDDKAVRFNDVNYYISSKNNMLFAKMINLNYEPVLPKLIDETKFGRDAIHDNTLFNRSLAIAMFTFLDGNPNNAHAYFRFDDDTKTHHNIYIGHDDREEIFGSEAKNPHFHFQTMDDNLLCCKKYKKGDDVKYLTGRCNAIDIEHLKNYLVDLDNQSEYTISKLLINKKHYGMPFLHFKSKNQHIHIGLNGLLKTYISSLNDDDKTFMLEFCETFETKYKDEVYEENGKLFGNVLKVLDFVQYLHDEISLGGDCKQRELLSNLEVACASQMIDGICNNSKKVRKKESKKEVENKKYEPIEKE